MIKRFLNIKKIATYAVCVGAAALLIAQTATFFAMQHWFLELFTHYIHYYAIAGTLLLLLSIFLKHRSAAFLCMIFTVIIAVNLPMLAPYLSKNPSCNYCPGTKTTSIESHVETNDSITILTSNFFYKNDEFGEFSELLNQEDPDIFIIHEASELWRIDPKSQFAVTHPYQYKSAESGVAGIFTASKLPVQFREVPLGSKFGVEITFTSEEENADEESTGSKIANLTILAVHPPAPITPEYAAERNQQLDDIALYAEKIMTTGSELIVTGDFNCTPFSPYFQEMLAASGLQDARLKAGSSILTTWHAHNPLFRIPIDHTLSSPGIAVLDFRRTAALKGSDHWPVLAEILLP